MARPTRRPLSTSSGENDDASGKAMRDVFVTGATGVIGRRLVPALVQAGHHVRAVARSPEKAATVTASGAHPRTVDLFNPDDVASAVVGCNAVIHLATSVPLGLHTMRKRAWKMNDRLRSEASRNLAAAAIDARVPTYIGESMTFPYTDAGSDWIDESHPRTYHSDSQTCVDAENAALQVTNAGLTGIALRFAMFHDERSGHIQSFLDIADRGFSPFVGAAGAYQSFVDTQDAAAAIVAALDVGAGVYNVVEPNPSTRGEHVAELAQLLGRKKLRSCPRLVEKLGGAAVEEMSRSQRVSCRALQETGSWEPRIHIMDRWKDLT